MLDDFDDTAIDRLVAVTGGSEGPLVVVQIRHLGGALKRAIEADGPTGAIEEPYQLFCLGVPVTVEVADAVQGSFAAIRAVLSDHLTGRRSFNFLADDDDPLTAFSPAVLRRLAAVKAAVDPHETIRSNHPVLPASRV